MAARLAAGTSAGVAAYIAVVFALYGFHELALQDGNDAYPEWYGTGDLLLRSVSSVAPGLLAGWLCRARGITAGALAGGLGGIAEAVFFGMLIGVPLAEFGLWCHLMESRHQRAVTVESRTSALARRATIRNALWKQAA